MKGQGSFLELTSGKLVPEFGRYSRYCLAESYFKTWMIPLLGTWHSSFKLEIQYAVKFMSDYLLKYFDFVLQPYLDSCAWQHPGGSSFPCRDRWQEDPYQAGWLSSHQSAPRQKPADHSRTQGLCWIRAIRSLRTWYIAVIGKVIWQMRHTPENDINIWKIQHVYSVKLSYFYTRNEDIQILNVAMSQSPTFPVPGYISARCTCMFHMLHVTSLHNCHSLYLRYTLSSNS